MNAESTLSWEMMITEPSHTMQANFPRLGSKNAPEPARPEKTGIIPLFQPAPPDDKVIRELNALAAQYPFCILFKAKSHDML
jgi:hypothetical protein